VENPQQKAVECVTLWYFGFDNFDFDQFETILHSDWLIRAPLRQVISCLLDQQRRAADHPYFLFGPLRNQL
jgi:hypothetical protein